MCTQTYVYMTMYVCMPRHIDAVDHFALEFVKLDHLACSILLRQVVEGRHRRGAGASTQSVRYERACGQRGLGEESHMRRGNLECASTRQCRCNERGSNNDLLHHLDKPLGVALAVTHKLKK